MSIDRVLCDTIISLCGIDILLLWFGSFFFLMQCMFVLEYISFGGNGIFPSRLCEIHILYIDLCLFVYILASVLH